MIDENAGQILSDGTVQQHCGDTRIDTARQTENYAVVAQLLLQFGDRRIDKRGGTPLLFRASTIDHEILQQLRSLQTVEYFGMELDGPNHLTI